MESSTHPPVGLIGIGLIGTALAERLLKNGYPVVGWDLDPARGECLRHLGGTPVSSAADILARCQLVCLSLPDLNVVTQVLQPLTLRPGQTLIDTTTGDPDQAVLLGANLAAQGVDYLDATISGNSEQVRQGDVTVMAGGSPTGFQHAEPVLRCFAREVFHVGPCGHGSKLKLVTNLVLGLNRAALAEGLAFAHTLGLNPAAALEILQHSAAYSRIMDAKGPKMVAHDFTPQARLSQHLKDVRLMLDAGAKAGAKLPLSTLHAALLQEAESRGLGPLDNSAILKVFEP
jgi:3-hydroxyisobutyrate dehydrogenase-like beta-hydroxyacid dehydrogenase